MSGEVVGIWLAARGGEALSAVPSAMAVAGEGLAGDRYLLRTGYWSTDPRLYDDVTLVSVEALAVASAEAGVDLTGGASRRNVEVAGVDLDALVGRRFRVGGAELRGERPCEPCRYLDGLVGGPAKQALTGRGGLRASVLVGGQVAVGDQVVPLD